MRNPLNGILGMAHLLADTSLDASQRSYLDAIGSSGAVLLTLVNDLLDLTALESGNVTIEPEPCDIEHLINQTLELAAPGAHSKGLSLGAFIDPAIEGDMLLDESRLRQVLTNLVSNAIKFTSAGGVRVDARLLPVPQAGDGPSAVMICIDVADTGEGIAPADQAMVFAPFGRTKSARSAGTEGTGLGLTLSRGLARAMGGSLVLLSSQRGEGTVMRLCVPVELDGPAPQIAEATLALAGERVLVAIAHSVEEECPETAALVETLRASGAKVQLVHDAAELSGPPVDIDHVLVDADFVHAMLWARLCLPGTSTRPVILLKPAQRSLLPEFRDAGFGGYLIRPVRRSSLIAMLTDRFESAEGPAFLADPADFEAAWTRPAAVAPLQILVADDSPVNAMLAQRALERAGHGVVCVEDGARAIAAMMERDAAPFDMAILDLSMPVLDGFATARQMRAMGFSGRILALSGNSDLALDTKLKAAGFDGFASKPITPHALQILVAKSARAGQ